MPVPSYLQQHPIFAGSRFGIMSGDNPKFGATFEGHENLVRLLHQMDLEHIETHGRWDGKPERSVLIKNPTRQQMESLGRIFGQESVVYSEGRNHQLIATNGPDRGKTNTVGSDGNPVDFFSNCPDDNYTHLPGHGYFRINFQFPDEPEGSKNVRKMIQRKPPLALPALGKGEGDELGWGITNLGHPASHGDRASTAVLSDFADEHGIKLQFHDYDSENPVTPTVQDFRSPRPMFEAGMKASRQNAEQWGVYDRRSGTAPRRGPLEPADVNSTHFENSVFYAPRNEIHFWEDVAKRSPLLRRSKNRLVHKTEEILKNVTIPKPTLTQYGQYGVSRGILGEAGKGSPTKVGQISVPSFTTNIPSTPEKDTWSQPPAAPKSGVQITQSIPSLTQRGKDLLGSKQGGSIGPGVHPGGTLMAHGRMKPQPVTGSATAPMKPSSMEPTLAGNQPARERSPILTRTKTSFRKSELGGSLQHPHLYPWEE